MLLMQYDGGGSPHEGGKIDLFWLPYGLAMACLLGLLISELNGTEKPLQAFLWVVMVFCFADFLVKLPVPVASQKTLPIEEDRRKVIVYILPSNEQVGRSILHSSGYELDNTVSARYHMILKESLSDDAFLALRAEFFRSGAGEVHWLNKGRE